MRNICGRTACSFHHHQSPRYMVACYNNVTSSGGTACDYTYTDKFKRKAREDRKTFVMDMNVENLLE